MMNIFQLLFVCISISITTASQLNTPRPSSTDSANSRTGTGTLVRRKSVQAKAKSDFESTKEPSNTKPKPAVPVIKTGADPPKENSKKSKSFAREDANYQEHGLQMFKKLLSLGESSGASSRSTPRASPVENVSSEDEEDDIYVFPKLDPSEYLKGLSILTILVTLVLLISYRA